MHVVPLRHRLFILLGRLQNVANVAFTERGERLQNVANVAFTKRCIYDQQHLRQQHQHNVIRYRVIMNILHEVILNHAHSVMNILHKVILNHEHSA